MYCLQTALFAEIYFLIIIKDLSHTLILEKVTLNITEFMLKNR